MAKNYTEAPWWWYITVLVFAFVVGLIVVTKENITLPVWGYIVSLIVGIVFAPFVSLPTYIFAYSQLSDATTEHHSLFTLRQWYCHKQPVENAGGSDAPWTPCR